MSLAIVRPAPACQHLAARLSAAGIAAFAEPIMGFSAGRDLDTLIHRFPLLPPQSLIIAVSKPAVEHAHQWMQAHGIAWRHDLRYVAVGQGSANLLQNVSGQSVDVPQREDSEGVLNLQALHAVAGRSVMILRGQDGRELIAETLTERGANVEYIEAYQRIWHQIETDTLYQRWHNTTSGIVVTSQAQLDHLWQLFTPSYQPWLTTLPLFVPSQRIVEHAKSLGFNTVSCVNSAANSELFATLSELSRTGRKG